MSKLDIGVGEEFPLDESAPQESRGGRRHRRGHHDRRAHHHHGHHHGHRRHGLLHLPLLLAVAGLAALIGAGRISPFATHAILAVAGVVILLAVIAHFVHHRHWHMDQHTQ